MSAPGTVSTSTLLYARNLKVHFPVVGGVFRRTVGHVKAVNGVSLELKAGEIVSVVGESGCGKSTLGNAILGLVPVTDGELRLAGSSVNIHHRKAWNAFRRDFQIIFQDPYSSLNPRHTVYEIVAEPMLVHGVCNRQEARERVAELLDTVGLSPDYMSRYPHAFSGGQRQRISIARCIGLKPKAIICDEIVSALDVSVQAQIINLLLRLKAELNLSLLFISHDLSLVRHISDRVHVMYLGKIVESGRAEDLFNAPRHPYTRALLDSIPTLDRNRRPGLLAGEVPSPVNMPSGCAFHTRCPLARDRCRSETPQLMDSKGGVSDNPEPGAQLTACWFADEVR
ncbi:MAG: ATP-binding cassette domain-containing protein [Leptospiraceae bacterium]|nr:ATP-binding cassette domain-containing protein [Leptospiraceae bacterium]